MLSDPFSLTSDVVINEAMMHLACGLSVLVVEGSDDVIALANHVDPSSVATIQAGGKKAALNVGQAVSLRPEAMRRVLVLVDRDDDDGLALDRYPSGAVIRTGGRDLDSELLSIGGVLERIILYLGMGSYVEGVEQLKTRTIELVGPVTALRRIASKRGLALKCSSLDFSYLLTLEKRVLLHEVCMRVLSASSDCSSSVAADEVVAMMYSTDEIEQHQGHDLHKALAAQLGKSVKPRDVQSQAWALVDTSAFKNCETGRRLGVWASRSGVSLWRTHGEA